MKTFLEYLAEVQQLHESEIPDEHINAVSGMEKFPKLQSSDPYDAWIFAKGIAGAHGSNKEKDFEAGFAKSGPVGQSLTVAPYTDEEARMIDVTKKTMGTPSVLMSPRGSSEASDTHKVSPHRNPGPIRFKHK